MFQFKLYIFKKNYKLPVSINLQNNGIEQNLSQYRSVHADTMSSVLDFPTRGQGGGWGKSKFKRGTFLARDGVQGRMHNFR